MSLPLGHGQRVLQYDACCLQQPIRCRQTCGSQPACPIPVIHPRDCSRFSAVWVCPNGRACPQVDHTRRPSAAVAAARSCDASALTRGLTAVLRFTSATIRFSIVHIHNIHDIDKEPRSVARRAVSCTSHHRPPGEALGNEAPPPRARRGRSRAEARGRGGQVGSSLVDATNSRYENRHAYRIECLPPSRVSRAVRAHEHARPPNARRGVPARHESAITYVPPRHVRHAHPRSTDVRARADS